MQGLMWNMMYKMRKTTIVPIQRLRITLVSSGVDLIFANSTPSAQAVAVATQEIPIVFTSVTDAVSAELVASMESPGGNVTGTIDNHPEAIPTYDEVH